MAANSLIQKLQPCVYNTFEEYRRKIMTIGQGLHPSVLFYRIDEGAYQNPTNMKAEIFNNLWFHNQYIIEEVVSIYIRDKHLLLNCNQNNFISFLEHMDKPCRLNPPSQYEVCSFVRGSVKSYFTSLIDKEVGYRKNSIQFK